uniref:Uncharacterized protein n=1 Tax=Arundo donax TaxID=35708 RepID=A0A0A9A528_ARUDO
MADGLKSSPLDGQVLGEIDVWPVNGNHRP